LCGIVRNIAASTVRRDLRRGGAPESLEDAAGELAIETDPAAQAISREEETLLWRTLAGMPASYREPLVLFYREEKSVNQVAQQLDLSQDTVKQRLSRGRAMLREEVAVLVESTLSRTRPGTAFTVGVLVALPMVAASTASAALAVEAAANTSASAAGKGFFAKLGLGALTGPFIGLVVAYLGSKAAACAARSERERKCVRRYSAWMTAFCFAMSIGLVVVLSSAGKRYTATAPGIVLGVLTWVAVLVLGVLLMSQRLTRAVNRIRIETGTAGDGHATALGTPAKTTSASEIP
jgi:hypothetical protein